MIIVTIVNNNCAIHTKCDNGILKCLCKLNFINNERSSNTVFRMTKSTIAHLKYINLLEDDFCEKAFEAFAKYLAIYRTKQLRLIYIMKIISTIIRYLKHVDKFDVQLYKHMLNKYKMVKFRHFDVILQEEIKTLSKSLQVRYLQLNADRTLALDNKTIDAMLEMSVKALSKYQSIITCKNIRKCVADVVFYTLVILSFYTGARTIATLYHLSLVEYTRLLKDGQIDTFGKNNIKITVYLAENVRVKYNNLLQLVNHVGQEQKYDDNELIFAKNCSIKQLYLRFDKMYKLICNERRPEWVKWHAARRWFLGEVFSNCGLKIASKAVSHKHMKTTIRYIQASTHCNDVHVQLNKVFCCK